MDAGSVRDEAFSGRFNRRLPVKPLKKLFPMI